MGKEIERIAGERKITVVKSFTAKNNRRGNGLTKQTLKGVDVCIDFSSPGSVVDNIRASASCGKNIVVGTTGWYHKLGEVRKMVSKYKIGLLYAPNFSLGMNIFSQVLAVGLQYVNRFNAYDVAIHETHHKGKADSPSGTALMLGDIVLRHVRSKKSILSETARRAIQPKQLHITSARVGNVVGTHKVLFDSEADSIELVHTAKNRSGFALGALIAAEWLTGKKGIYTMNDVIASL